MTSCAPLGHDRPLDIAQLLPSHASGGGGQGAEQGNYKKLK
jgi:hypothetical protein